MRQLLAALAMFLVLTAAGVVRPGPAQAQFLGTFLETQRSNNLRMHQQRMIQRGQEQRRAARPAPSARTAIRPAPRLSQPGPADAASIREQHRRRLEPEYYRRVGLYGRPAADRWLAQEARRLGREAARYAR